MLLWFYDQKNKSERPGIVTFRHFFPLCPWGIFSMAVSTLRNSKKRKERGNPLIASFTFNPIPGTQNTLFKEGVCTWDGTLQFLVGEWQCLSTKVDISLCSDRAHAVSLPCQTSQSSQTAARDSYSYLWQNPYFFHSCSFHSIIMEFYELLQMNCAPFLIKIRVLSSFIPSWGVLMGTK